ncbi:MAG TPA: hypothetical protein VJ850_09075 [Candidatus Limnocylindrales bacterium]|nr:hypothetical protein [Candidatus Limnocylindrales bacterium]
MIERWVEALLTISVPAGWTVLVTLLVASDRGWKYLALPSREPAQADVAAAQPEALSVAALVFAGIALVGTDAALGTMADLLLVSLSCFAIVWASAHWFTAFSVQLTGDGFRWTGLATFLAAVFEFAERATPGTVGKWAVMLAMIALAYLSARGAYSHWHNAVDAAKKPPVVAPPEN